MMVVRRIEQNNAAIVGQYGVMFQLDHCSSGIKNPSNPLLKNDLKEILAATKPDIVYTHNLADKHDTHIGVAVAALQAMRELKWDERPKMVIGCEVWRNLDWMPDRKKIIMDVSTHTNLAYALNGVFDSQIAGGKRYDLATIGRRTANATFFEPHATDEATQLIFGMDLTPLIRDESKDFVEYVTSFVETFREDVRSRLVKHLGERKK